jgi:hypothetical protein
MRHHSVTVRGLDIDATEIEQTLRAWPACAEAALLVRSSAEGSPVLVAYVVLAGEAPPGSWEADLAGFLRDRLPPFMIPAALVAVDRIPSTASGAVDEAALPAPVVHEERLSESERLLVDFLAPLIGCRPENLGLDDDYFLLGGDSVTVIHLLAAVELWTGVQMDPDVMFELNTVRVIREMLDSLHSGWYDEARSVRDAKGTR